MIRIDAVAWKNKRGQRRKKVIDRKGRNWVINNIKYESEGAGHIDNTHIQLQQLQEIQ